MPSIKLLDKPVKIKIINPEGKAPVDYEMVGKVLDNFVLQAQIEEVDLTEPGVRYFTFCVGRSYEYYIGIETKKNHYNVLVEYIRDITGKDKNKVSRKAMPKEQLLMDKAKAEYEAKQKEASKEDD